MHPPNDDYLRFIDAAIRATITDGREAGALALAPIAYPPHSIQKQPTITPEKAAALFRRDRFCCRYCGRQTIPTHILALLSSLYPETFPYHPNWKGGLTHPAVITRSPVIDHVDPVALGGSSTANDNLVTVCWPCNRSKADLTLEQLGWPPPRPVPDTDWDGLCSLYRPLWEAAERPEAGGHRRWLAALGC